MAKRFAPVARELLERLQAQAFGSKVRGDARAMSDLDILRFPKEPLSALDRALLREDFAESDLPFRGDLVDATMTDVAFLRAIESESIPLA
jgi:hypothetical protein